MLDNSIIDVDLHWKSFVEKGDHFSFSSIYNSYVDNLYSYGVSLGFRRDLCKDAIQDTFFKLYIHRVKLAHVKNATAYIFKSFKNRLIDLSQKKMNEESLVAVTESFTVDVTVLDHLINSEKAEMLKRKVSSLLEGLTANQREVVYLKYMIGLEHKEIASILNIQEESARKLLYRTMEKLRQQASDDDLSEAMTLFSLILMLQRFL